MDVLHTPPPPLPSGPDWTGVSWRSICIDEALGRWLALSPLDKKTVRIYRRAVNAFRRATGALVMGDIDQRMVSQFQDARIAAGKLVTTVNNDVKGIVGLMKFVARRTNMPAERLREISHLFLKERKQPGPPDHYSREEFDILTPIAYRIAPWFGLAFELSVWTGARRTELRFLNREDFDLEKRILRLTRYTKYGKHRTVSLCAPAVEAIKKHAPPSGAVFPARNVAARTPYVSDDTFRQNMKRLAKLSGIKCGWHKGRRTFTTWLVQQEVPVPDVARELGHSNLEMLYRHYYSWVNGYNKKIENIVPKTGTMD